MNRGNLKGYAFDQLAGRIQRGIVYVTNEDEYAYTQRLKPMACQCKP